MTPIPVPLVGLGPSTNIPQLSYPPPGSTVKPLVGVARLLPGRGRVLVLGCTGVKALACGTPNEQELGVL